MPLTASRRIRVRLCVGSVLEIDEVASPDPLALLRGHSYPSRSATVIADLIGNLLFHYSLPLHLVSIREAVIADLIRNLLVICPN